MLKRFLVVFRRVIRDSLANPLNATRIAAGLLFFVSAVMTLGFWIVPQDRSAVELPLLVMSVSGILMLSLGREAGFTLGVAVVVIGTVAAGERFMLATTALIRADPDQAAQIVTSLGYGRGAAAQVEDAVDIKALAARVAAAIEEGDTDAGARVIQEAISRSRLEGLVEQVGGAETPLFELSEDVGGSWRRFVSDYRSDDFFVRDMDNLKRLGLVEFSGTRFDRATLTDLGRQVVQVQTFDSSIEINTVDLLPLIDTAAPDAPPIGDLPFSSDVLGEFTEYRDVWYHLVVPAAGAYRIETLEPDSPSDVDTVVEIFEELGGALIGSDDDGGQGLLSRLDVTLEQRTYVVHLFSLGGYPGAFRIRAEPIG